MSNFINWRLRENILYARTFFDDLPSSSQSIPILDKDIHSLAARKSHAERRRLHSDYQRSAVSCDRNGELSQAEYLASSLGSSGIRLVHATPDQILAVEYADGFRPPVAFLQYMRAHVNCDFLHGMNLNELVTKRSSSKVGQPDELVPVK